MFQCGNRPQRHSITILNGDFHSHLPAGQYDASITLTPTSETITPLQASAVLKVLADNDFDGMPDEWEILHGFEPTANDATGDPDRDGFTNHEEYENGTDPHTPDNITDADNDGMADRWETLHGLDPAIDDSANDPDSDVLVNLSEFQHGTHPNLEDSDSDGMPDGWEVAHSLNPLQNDAAQDPDGDGLTNLEEFNLSTDPQVPNDPDDLDNDGMLDAWETRHGLDPATDDSALDPDKDGLTNIQEFQLRTKPEDRDTDRDMLPDGWEHQYNLDPKNGMGRNGNSGDPDTDAAGNFLEWQYGCDPNNQDTDGDGTGDGEEIAKGSDPTDSGDGGNPPPADEMIEVPFRVGDPSDSHSETWQLTITPKGPDDKRPPIKIASSDYGEMAEQPVKLRKNNQYEIAIEHLATDPEHLEYYGESDYDWEAQIDAKPEIQVLDDLGIHNNADRYFIVKNHWIVDNKDGLLGTVDQSFDADDYTPGKKALMMPVDFKLRNEADVEKGWDSTEADDWTSVGVGKTNSIVRLSILGATADVGTYYELVPKSEKDSQGQPQTYLGLTNNTIEGEITDFDIAGSKETTDNGCGIIVREKAPTNDVAGTLNSHVFTERTVYFQVFHASDDRIPGRLSDVPTDAPTPTYAEIEGELNAVFTPQCNIKFVKRLTAPTILDKCYGAFSTDGNFYKDRWTGNHPPVEDITGKLPAGKFLSIVIVKHIVSEKDAIGFHLTTTPYVFVNYNAGVRVVAHETGHALELSTQGQGQANKHDNGPGPGGIEPMLSSPNKGHQTRWMRQKDWKKSNDTANGPLYK